jgi:hypothetical protein
MKLAVMQPYFFPYIGYYQLVAAVDKFVIYDDVNYIKQGWINRNNILVGGAASRFSVPLNGVSSFARIYETQIDDRQYPLWRERFRKTLAMNYVKSPQYAAVLTLINSVLDQAGSSIGDLAAASVLAVADYLELPTEIVKSSRIYGNDALKAAERVLDICKREEAAEYINMIGGTSLYSREWFAERGVQLHFLQPQAVAYTQFKKPFVPWLSVIDVLMHCGKEETRQLLTQYALV